MRRVVLLAVLLPVVYVSMLTCFGLPTPMVSAAMSPHSTATSLVRPYGGCNGMPMPC